MPGLFDFFTTGPKNHPKNSPKFKKEANFNKMLKCIFSFCSSYLKKEQFEEINCSLHPCESMQVIGSLA